jgi:hypothetical protein
MLVVMHVRCSLILKEECNVIKFCPMLRKAALETQELRKNSFGYDALVLTEIFLVIFSIQIPF